jgi:HPt (histidine-containing phosphotransfer) domain-containing protein
MTRPALRSDLFPRIKQAALNTIARMRAPRHSVRVASELRELLPRFLANRRLDLEQLREALARGDFEEARRIGHSLRGAGGGYGFDEITRRGNVRRIVPAYPSSPIRRNPTPEGSERDEQEEQRFMALPLQ